LLHPITPTGCEMVREYLGVGDEIWKWEHIFEPLDTLLNHNEKHRLKFLEERVDFFKKHESQFDI
jgi:methionyl-tRNA synthetase